MLTSNIELSVWIWTYLQRLKKTIKTKKVVAWNYCALTFSIPVRRAPDPPSGIFLYYNDSKMPSCKQYHNICCLMGKLICVTVSEPHNLGLGRLLLGFFLSCSIIILAFTYLKFMKGWFLPCSFRESFLIFHMSLIFFPLTMCLFV